MAGYRHKTRPGRLRALDRALLHLEGGLLTRCDAGPIVDLGLGARPWTTLELAEAIDAPIVGLDVDPAVVARAAADHAHPRVSYRVGSFDDVPPRARLVRALNVLRDYSPAEAEAAHAAMGAHLVEGGLVVEGSCGPSGEVGVVHLLRRGLDLRREALLFWTDGSRGSAPILFRDRLPRDLRASVRAGHPLGDLFARWMAAFGDVRGAGGDRLAASVEALGDPELIEVGPGTFRWRPAGGVPRR